MTELEERYPEFPGLNLTWEVREGMVKHESEYDISAAREYDPALRGNLETQIANIADELAYTTHDLDDGLRSGMIAPAMLDGIALWGELRETFAWKGPQLTDVERHRMIRELVGIMVTDLVKATHDEILSSGVTSALGVQQVQHNLVGYTADMKRRHRDLKDFVCSFSQICAMPCDGLRNMKKSVMRSKIPGLC